MSNKGSGYIGLSGEYVCPENPPGDVIGGVVSYMRELGLDGAFFGVKYDMSGCFIPEWWKKEPRGEWYTVQVLRGRPKSMSEYLQEGKQWIENFMEEADIDTDELVDLLMRRGHD